MSRYCRRPILPSHLALAAALALTLTPPAWAAPPATGAPAKVPEAAAESADSLSERAIQRFQAKDYNGAVADFNRAYALDPDPNYLFNIGRVYEEAADLARAVDYYERFIKEPGVDLDSRGIALERMRMLRAILHETQRGEPEPAPTPAPAPEPVVTEPAPASLEAGPSKGKGRGLRIGGAVLLGLGGGALIGGGVVGGLTLRQARLLGETDGYDARQELIRVGTINAQVTDALLISGGVLAATGLTMLLIGRHSGRAVDDDVSLARRGLRVAPWIGGAVHGAAVTGRF